MTCTCTYYTWGMYWYRIEDFARALTSAILSIVTCEFILCDVLTSVIFTSFYFVFDSAVMPLALMDLYVSDPAYSL
jgi:hypothetical protein